MIDMKLLLKISLVIACMFAVDSTAFAQKMSRTEQARQQHVQKRTHNARRQNIRTQKRTHNARRQYIRNHRPTMVDYLRQPSVRRAPRSSYHSVWRTPRRSRCYDRRRVIVLGF